MGGGEVDHGLGMRGLGLLVLGEVAEVAEPSEGSLDDPALGQDDKAVQVDSFHDLRDELAMQG